jgi:hypothetical protein
MTPARYTLLVSTGMQTVMLACHGRPLIHDDIRAGRMPTAEVVGQYQTQLRSAISNSPSEFPAGTVRNHRIERFSELS